MKGIIVLIFVMLAGCSTSNKPTRWDNYSIKNSCIALNEKRRIKVFLSSAVTTERMFYKFSCGDVVIWSDLGRYAVPDSPIRVSMNAN